MGLKEVSGHMGHNIKSALKCYVAPQKVHAANAAQRITKIFQAQGEVQYKATVKTLWDPVRLIQIYCDISVFASSKVLQSVFD